MNNLRAEEQTLVGIVREKFKPQAIILVGSQANGTATDTSDWDVFLFCGERKAGIELQEGGMTIDVNFSAWPTEDSYLDTGFGPVQPIKVLFDESQGRLGKLIANTEAAYMKGPLQLQAEIAALHLRSYERYIEKVSKYENDEIIQFYYKGMFLNTFLTVWFEQQNIWAPAPAKALSILRNSQPRIFTLLQKLIDHSGVEVSEMVSILKSELELIKQN